jgi:DMSO/TMAO reductase YedYZ molybdopterin-dependent catalytic subunit
MNHKTSNPSSNSRRNFLLASAAAAASACAWDGGPKLQSTFAGMSRVNDWMSARLFSPNSVAPKYSAAERSTAFPAYKISETMPMLADPAAWRLKVTGMVRTPLLLSVSDITAISRMNYTVKHHCVEGWSAIATWAGVPLRAIAEKAGVDPAATFVRFDSFDSDYYNGWDIASAMHQETMLAYAFNDEMLTSDHGAPLRLYAPHKLGYKLTKFLTTVTFTDKQPGGYWEDQGYPWFGGI